MQKCKKKNTKKYITRNSPPYSAVDCIGMKKKGNDGYMYISELRGKAKSARWYSILKKSNSKSKNKSSRPKSTASRRRSAASRRRSTASRRRSTASRRRSTASRRRSAASRRRSAASRRRSTTSRRRSTTSRRRSAESKPKTRKYNDEESRILYSSNAWEILGVKESDGFNNARKKYLKLILKYHPDKYDGNIMISKKLNRAYSELKQKFNRFGGLRYFGGFYG